MKRNWLVIIYIKCFNPAWKRSTTGKNKTNHHHHPQWKQTLMKHRNEINQHKTKHNGEKVAHDWLLSPSDAAIVQPLFSSHNDVESATEVIWLHIHDLMTKRVFVINKCIKYFNIDIYWSVVCKCLTCWNESSNSVCLDTEIFTWLGKALDWTQGKYLYICP